MWGLRRSLSPPRSMIHTLVLFCWNSTYKRISPWPQCAVGRFSSSTPTERTNERTTHEIWDQEKRRRRHKLLASLIGRIAVMMTKCEIAVFTFTNSWIGPDRTAREGCEAPCSGVMVLGYLFLKSYTHRREYMSRCCTYSLVGREVGREEAKSARLLVGPPAGWLTGRESSE